MNFLQLTLLVPVFACALFLVGCGEKAETTVMPTAPEVAETYEADSFPDTSDESQN